MSYLNNEYSLNYSIEQPQETSESETQFLKIKLIETHSKFIHQLQYSKTLELELDQTRKKLQVHHRQYQNLNGKYSQLSNRQQRMNSERIKQLELALVDSEKKNDLLRFDLQGMRNKTLELVSINQQLEDHRGEYEHSLNKLTDKFNIISKELKIKEISIEEHRQEIDKYRAKYQRQITHTQEADRQIQNIKREKADLGRCLQDLQINFKSEKDKQTKLFHQFLLLQKESKEWKHKAEHAHEETVKAKDELYQLKARTTTEERNLVSQLERITHDYNNLQTVLKQKQTELTSARRKPLEGISRKKNAFEQTKQLVGKLQRQELKQIEHRSSPSRERPSPLRARPSRTLRQEKEEYLSIIESVGSKQSQMLACNMQKKKILGQIDKIDETRVKTKDMISKRRRLEVELQNQQRNIDNIRNQLKKMKVM